MLETVSDLPGPRPLGRRLLALALVLCALVLVVATSASRSAVAQEPGASVDQPAEDAPAPRSERGVYLNLLWLVLMIVSVGAWLYATGWVCDDARGIRLAHERWTSIMLGAGMFGLLWVFLAHAAFSLLLLLCAGGALALYVRERNRHVPSEFTLFSKRHTEKLATKLPIQRESAEERERLQITVTNEAKQTLAQFVAERAELGEAAAMLTDWLARASLSRSQVIRVELAGEGHVARFNVDGVMQTVDVMEPQLGQAVVALSARFAGLEGKGKAVGRLLASLPGEKDVEITVRGVRTGGGAAIVFALPDWTRDLHQGGLDALGMYQAMAEIVKKTLGQPTGAILVSSPSASGRTMTLHALVSEIDIFTTDVVTLESRIEHDLAQVVRHEVDLASNEAFQPLFERVVRDEPNVVVVDGLTGRAQTRSLLEFATDKGRLLATVQAGGAAQVVESIVRDVDGGLASRALTLVLNQRLVRKLCPHCKEPIEPSPQVLAKLDVDPQQPGAWFKPVGCESCVNTGYQGRMALFEMLIVNDRVRDVIAAGGATAEAVSNAAGKAALRTLRQDGILKVRQGITALQEIRRVLQ